MIIDKEGYEDFNCQDIAIYAKKKLDERGFTYRIVYPTDPIAISYIVKAFEKQRKGKKAVIEFIDEAIENLEGRVTSLSFLRPLVKEKFPSFNKKKDIEMKKDYKYELTDEDKAWLENLKKTS